MPSVSALASSSASSHIPEHNADTLDVERLRRDYYQSGCAIVRKAIDPALPLELIERFCSFFRAIIARETGGCSDEDNVDALHGRAAELIGPDRAKHFLTMGRDMPAFSALVSAPSLMTVLHALFQTADLQTIADSNTMRIDRPSSEETNLDWHQDYPYNMLAMDAATAWMPCVPITRAMGSLRVVPQISPLLPIVYDVSAKRQFHNSRYIRLQNLDALAPQFERQAVTLPDMFPGDIALLHALCAHRSGTNASRASRWVATARYGPFSDDALYARCWFTARAKYSDIFRLVHPDMFQEESDDRKHDPT